MLIAQNLKRNTSYPNKKMVKAWCINATQRTISAIDFERPAVCYPFWMHALAEDEGIHPLDFQAAVQILRRNVPIMQPTNVSVHCVRKNQQHKYMLWVSEYVSPPCHGVLLFNKEVEFMGEMLLTKHVRIGGQGRERSMIIRPPRSVHEQFPFDYRLPYVPDELVDVNVNSPPPIMWVDEGSFGEPDLYAKTKNGTAVKSTLYRCGACNRPCHSKCSRCSKEHYCDGDCQRLHWPEHKLTCQKM